MTTAPDPLSEFATCRSVNDANDVYQRLYAELVPMEIGTYNALSEAHRHALELLANDQSPAEPKEDDGRVRGRLVRNWAAKQGIPLAPKGRVAVSVENEYRAAHNMPLLPAEAPPATLEDAGVSSSVVRAWAIAQNIPVGARGRVHPDIIRQYIDAHGGGSES